MPITVRAAFPEDAATLEAFQLAMALETEGLKLDPIRLRRGVEAALRDPSRGSYRIAEAEGAVVGCLLLTREWSDWRNAEVWWIQSVYVAPPARGRGVYRALHGAVLEEASSRADVAGVRLYVDLRNREAQMVYARLGMDGDHYRVFEWMKKEREA